MARGYVPLLLLVAGIWGASFMFIEIAGEELEPAPMMALRLLLAALVLFPFLFLQEGVRAALRDLRAAGPGLVILGIFNNALPFTLIAWGQKHIDSGIAAIANAPVPIFVALLALKFRPSERVRGLRLAGVLVGFVGVGVLAGLNPDGGWLAIAGTLACTGAALSYAGSNLYAQSRFAETQPLVMVAASTLSAAILLTPLALIDLPGSMPGWETWAAVAALGIGGTAVALILYYRMLAGYGASRSSLVTYLIPSIALLYGATILDEPLTLNAIAGLVLILGGVALGAGVLRVAGLRRREDVVPAAPRS